MPPKPTQLCVRSTFSLPIDAIRALCEITQIKHDIYRKLCSIRALEKPIDILTDTVIELDARLETWRQDFLGPYKPGEQEPPATLTPTLYVQILSAHFAYYHCLITIHRRHAYYGQLINDSSAPSISKSQVRLSRDICFKAARTSSSMIKHIPQNNHIFSGYESSLNVDLKSILTYLHTALSYTTPSLLTLLFVCILSRIHWMRLL